LRVGIIMQLINHTPFPALTYTMVDTHDQAFHVIVMRATLTLRPDGQLVFADEQLPLCTSDTYHGEIKKSSVAQESDLSPFKPKCDVNVIASAHAPGGKPSRRFTAGIRISRPGTSAPRPRGLNPTMAPSEEELARWEKQVQAGTLICEKLLVINGPRYWKRGLFFGWRLTGAAPFLAMPIRYEYAYGGENRVEQNCPEARNVRKKYRLTPDQRAVHPDGPEQAPVAHEACMTNPVGCGFALPWYRNAMNLGKITAPLIVAPGEPIRSFGKAYAPQGLGIIGRACNRVWRWPVLVVQSGPETAIRACRKTLILNTGMARIPICKSLIPSEMKRSIWSICAHMTARQPDKTAPATPC
jgi:hypothetical protein